MQSTIEKERIKIERDVSELYKSKMAAIQDQANKTVFSLEEQMKVEREGTLQLQTMVNNIKQVRQLHGYDKYLCYHNFEIVS